MRGKEKGIIRKGIMEGRDYKGKGQSRDNKGRIIDGSNNREIGYYRD